MNGQFYITHYIGNRHWYLIGIDSFILRVILVIGTGIQLESTIVFYSVSKRECINTLAGSLKGESKMDLVGKL